MGEERVLAIYVALHLGISIAAMFLVPHMLTRAGSIYADYRATLYTNLTLVEEFTYHIGEQGKTMLYRY